MKKHGKELIFKNICWNDILIYWVKYVIKINSWFPFIFIAEAWQNLKLELTVFLLENTVRNTKGFILSSYCWKFVEIQENAPLGCLNCYYSSWIDWASFIIMLFWELLPISSHSLSSFRSPNWWDILKKNYSPA